MSQVCVNCANWSMRKASMGKLGWGICLVDMDPLGAYRNLAPEHKCHTGKFVRAKDGDIQARVSFIEKVKL